MKLLQILLHIFVITQISPKIMGILNILDYANYLTRHGIESILNSAAGRRCESKDEGTILRSSSNLVK